MASGVSLVSNQELSNTASAFSSTSAYGLGVFFEVRCHCSCKPFAFSLIFVVVATVGSFSHPFGLCSLANVAYALKVLEERSRIPTSRRGRVD